AAVGVAGRALVAARQAEAAHEAVSLLVIVEAQAHAVGIVLAAAKAVVARNLDERGVVSATVSQGAHIRGCGTKLPCREGSGNCALGRAAPHPDSKRRRKGT